MLHLVLNLLYWFCTLVCLAFILLRKLVALLFAKISGSSAVSKSYDIASGRYITLCIKIDKPLVVYRFETTKLLKWR